MMMEKDGKNIEMEMEAAVRGGQKRTGKEVRDWKNLKVQTNIVWFGGNPNYKHKSKPTQKIGISFGLAFIKKSIRWNRLVPVCGHTHAHTRV